MIIAILIMTVALGSALHLNEFAARTTSRSLELATNNAGAVAEALAANAGSTVSGTYCLQYSNGTGNCNAFSCSGSVYAASRLVACSGPANGVCSLEVHTCG
jgi:hypothetical protein